MTIGTRSHRLVNKMLMGAAVIAVPLLSACGGGGGSSARPAPTPAPVPAPTPTPAPTPPPGGPTPGPYDTAEFRGSDGPVQHGALEAYNAGATGDGIILGVIDSGINVNSSEFAGRIHPDSRDFAGNRGLSDEGGHGSAVTSVAAGAKNNNATHGIAFDTDILVLRTDTPGSCGQDDPSDPDDDGCSHNSSAIAAAIDQARVSGARVINISLGGPSIGSQTRNAIANATAAGVVVVVSAGNDGAATPDGFASGIADNGNGLVIISGSVGTTGNISSFSNRAGGQANAYLAALGERVRADDNQGQPFLWSGTSFSAPQISGAVALLAQAFPNLSGDQIVNLLFSSAQDAGTAGIDSIYGNGILDIAAAFQPQGQSRIAGTRVAIDPQSSTGQTSAAMGDAALRGQNVGAVILDGFDRAFALDLAHDLQLAGPAFKLTSSLQGDRRHMAASSAGVDIAVNIGWNDRGLLGRNHLALSPARAREARMLAASAVARLSPDMKVAFGFRRSAQGLAAQMRGHDQPAFLVAPSPASDRGFTGEVQSALALRRDIAGFGITASAESGNIRSAWDRTVEEFLPDANRQRARFSSFGLALDRRFGPAELSLSAAWLAEDQSVLGARFSEAIGTPGARTLFIDGQAAVDLGNGWRTGASWRQGWTQVDSAGLISGGTLRATAFAADIGKRAVFAPDDRFSLRFAQPLRVSDGGLRLDLPVSYDYATGLAGFGQRSLNLAPQGRELITELAYGTPLFGGYLDANFFWRQEPGHFEVLDDDLGAALRFQLKF